MLSVICYKTIDKPSFLTTKKLLETKYVYLILVEFGNYISSPHSGNGRRRACPRHKGHRCAGLEQASHVVEGKTIDEFRADHESCDIEGMRNRNDPMQSDALIVFAKKTSRAPVW
ncbi:hypothetical protein [Pseudomonas sp. CCOS 191]|uniref:hypothetical protein n=1 Tax=Pseudomonas sp. CCOS 191 TaxID=1649877 RepID=UPI0018E6B3A4|nr:hypothetical protein [Pseudomonas sp. CCOS 191]MBI6955534.1 hypothetical protein [Pseudomonas sp. CCOS 191]